MMYFRDRKYGGTLNTSFFVKNDGDYHDLSYFQVGDKVSIFFRLTPAQAQVIMDRDDPNMRLSDAGDEPETCIPFRVVERSHGLIARGGETQLIVSGVMLEADTGVWEDILRWVCCGERPAWVEDDAE